MRGRLIGLALALVATAALAQTQQQRDWCFAPGPTNGQAIEGCTALIESARQTSASKAAAYHHRGFAYERDGWLAWAIADYRAALKLDPTQILARDSLKRLGVTP